MNNKLLLHEEILLLALRDDKGTFSSGMYLYSVAGAMVSELLLQERIVANNDRQQTVAIIDETPTGDELLDELLQQMVTAEKHKGLKDWVFQAGKIKQLPHRVAGQLCKLGVLKEDEKKILWVFTQRIYPELDGTWEDAIRDRMAGVMFNKKTLPDERTAVLIALASHAGLLKPNFVPEELRQHQERVKQLANGDLLAAEATQSAIQAVQTAMMVAATVPAMVAATTASTSS